MTMTAEDKLYKARIGLQKTNPFFAYLLLHSQPIEDKTIETMGVDANGKMYYNPEFVHKLNMQIGELDAVVCHEILHVALEHLYRGKYMQHHQFIGNIAADLVVNDILVESNMRLPEMPLKPYNHKVKTPQFTIENIHLKCVEEIYDEIMAQLPPPGPCPICGGNQQCDSQSPGKNKDGDCNGCGEEECDGECQSGNGSGSNSDNQCTCEGLGQGTFDKHIISDKDKSSEERRNNEKKWKKLVSKAGHYAKTQGLLPAGIQRRLGEIFESKINWKQALAQYITKAIPYDYTYSRPSHKSISTGFYMPSVRKDQSLEIVVAIDTSGSIGNEELGTFIGEMIGIAQTYKGVEMRIIDCDADIQSDILVSNGNISKIRNISPKGGGGTSHIPIYKYIQDKYPTTKILINFTDGYTSFPDQQKWKWDSIWVLSKHSCEKEHIPFGKVIKVDSK